MWPLRAILQPRRDPGLSRQPFPHHGDGGLAGKSVPATIFLAGRADAPIHYCSGQADTLRDVPSLILFPLAQRLDVTVVYGLALMSDKPAAMRLTLFIRSDEGQAILTRHGLVSVSER